jgi:hypothetical protein
MSLAASSQPILLTSCYMDGQIRTFTDKHGLSRGFGETGTCVRYGTSLASWLVEDALAEEVKVGAAIGLALEQLEARDLPFRLPLRMSGQLYPMT